MAEFVFPGELLKKFPRTVREELPTLPEENQKDFLERYNQRAKKVLIAYLLSIFYGLNFVYLEETGTGIWYWFTVAGIGIWYIVNFFLVPGMVKNYNSVLAIKILAEVRPVSDKPEF